MDDEILDKAKSEAQKWLDAASFTGDYNVEACEKALAGRVTEDGKPVTVIVVRSPDEVSDALRRGVEIVAERTGEDVEQLRLELKEAHRCVWDYYWFAFYESAMKAAGLSHWFTDQSLFPAFQAGIGHIVNMGQLIVGVMRPEAYRDDEFRLHCENGPAITWGTKKWYFWRGVEVEADWIEHPEAVDPKLALTHGNVEQRRCLQEIVGWDRILEQLGDVKSISTDEFGEILETRSIGDDDGRPARFMRVACPSSMRIYVTRVPHDAQSPRHALGWRYHPDRPESMSDVDPNWYAPAVET